MRRVLVVGIVMVGLVGGGLRVRSVLVARSCREMRAEGLRSNGASLLRESSASIERCAEALEQITDAEIAAASR